MVNPKFQHHTPFGLPKGCVVLKFRIYHIWLQGIILTSLMKKCLLSGIKALLSTTTANPTPEKLLSPKIFLYHNWNRRTVRGLKESFPWDYQTIYTTPMLISKIILREEAMEMTKLELFLNLFTVNYLKEIVIPEMNNLLKHLMDLQ